MTPTLTICVPTIGRPGLARTLDSIAPQALIAGDRVLVVFDSYESTDAERVRVRSLVERYGPPFEYHEHDGGEHFFGVAQFNHAMTLADTDFFCGLGDDDIYVDDAVARLRPQLEAGRATLIQFLSPWRQVLWDAPTLRASHISGCCLIAPVSCLSPMPRDHRVEVDFDWIVNVVRATGQEPLWLPSCLITARPESPRTLIGHGLKVLLVSPGASHSTADVDAGLRYGLAHHGVEVIRYRLDARIDRSHRWLFANWRRAKKANPTIEKPTTADVFYQAGIDALATALRHEVDCVLVVSAMFLHPDVIVLMKRAGLRVVTLFTESPYDLQKELVVAALVDGCWTNERSCVDAFAAVNPRAGYLPHGWHPERHRAGPQPGDDTLPAHDVVFVGTGFQERVRWLAAIDWSGIDFGLYGTWEIGSRHPLRQFIRGTQVDNATTAALYRRAKIGLNLYRTSAGWGKEAQSIAHAESLNPRAYELARCGVFHLSTARAEVGEVFGDLVPTFTTPHDAGALLRSWLADPAGRARVQAQLPACVAESSWVDRSSLVIGDLQTLLHRRAA